MVMSMWLDGKQDCRSCKKGIISASVINASDWCVRHACTNFG